jgi:hypothetical protein
MATRELDNFSPEQTEQTVSNGPTEASFSPQEDKLGEVAFLGLRQLATSGEWDSLQKAKGIINLAQVKDGGCVFVEGENASAFQNARYLSNHLAGIGGWGPLTHVDSLSREHKTALEKFKDAIEGVVNHKNVNKQGYQLQSQYTLDISPADLSMAKEALDALETLHNEK